MSKDGRFRKLRKFNSVIDLINRKIAGKLFYLLLVLMLLVCFEVMMRYIFNRPTMWSMEVNQFLFLTLAALSGGYVLVVNGHVNVDIFYRRFSTRTKAIVSIITSLFIFSYLIILLWNSWGAATDSLACLETSGSGWDPPIYPIRFLIPVGAFLILLQAIARFNKYLIQAITGTEEMLEHTDIMGDEGN